MPELPEVECVRRTLQPSLLGRTVAQVRVGLDKLARPTPQAFAKGLRGRTVAATRRHGKLLILDLDDASIWAVHLGMTGQVIGADHRPKADHIHITVSFTDGGPKFYFRDPRQFGFMAWCPDQAALAAGPLANMGPDALAIPREEFIARLARRRSPIKSLLLDQRNLAGVGNIYADEALHRAGIGPLARPAEGMADQDLGRLYDVLQETLAEALALGGSSVKNFVDANGRAGTFQETHRVYRRTGQPCPCCGAAIERVVVAGRSTHFCPDCQG